MHEVEHLCTFMSTCVCLWKRVWEREITVCLHALVLHEWVFMSDCMTMHVWEWICVWQCVRNSMFVCVFESVCVTLCPCLLASARASERVRDWMWVSTILLHCILNECQYVPVTSTLWCSIHTHSYPFHDIYPLYDHIVCVHVCVCMSVWERNAFKAYLLSAEPPGQQVWEARRVCCSVVKLCRKCLLKCAHFAFLLLL